MNTKEQIIEELKEKILNTIRFGNENYIQQLERLIAATEAAIFDVPTDEEILIKAKSYSHKSSNEIFREGHVDDFKAGCNFILNYKNKSDGK